VARLQMGRTVPSFRIALGMEKEDWKPFRNALDKKDRKEFDEMFELPKFYISACSNSVHYVRLHPILMSIILYHFKQLTKCISKVEQIEARVNNKHGRRLTVRENEEAEQREEKSKAVNPSGQNNTNVVLIPVRENSKKTARRKKLQTAVKEESILDSYFISNEID
jgi:hypothetical protein